MYKTCGRVYILAVAQTSEVLYDTHAAVRRLTGAGMPEPHAEAVVREQVHLIEHNLATKADVEAVRADIETLRLETKADIETLRLETKADIETLRLETKADIETLRLETKADIDALRLETKANIEMAKVSQIKWTVGTGVAVAGLVIAALKWL